MAALSDVIKVEWSPSSDPLATSPTWVDITARVKRIGISRGRGGVFDLFGAGTCSVVIDNTDHGISTSTWYKHRQLRVTATATGPTTRRLFWGHVVDTPHDQRSAPWGSLVTINAHDLLGEIARLEYNASSVAAEGSGARVTRILNALSIPGGWQSVATGYATVTAMDNGVVNALQHLQDVVEAEQGALYVSAAGVVRFEDRYELMDNLTSSVATFSDEPNALNLTGGVGSFASAPDAAPLDITGDIDIRADVTATDWTPAAVSTIAAKWSGAGSQLSYILYLEAAGTLTLGFSSNGTSGLFRTSTAATGVVNGQRKWVRATLDVNNGAAGHDVKFYLSDDGTTWTQLGATVTTAGTTSIASTTAGLRAGSNSDGGERLTGKIHRVQILNGIAGTTVFDANFGRAAAAAATFVESSANAATVTVSSPASIVVSDVNYLRGSLVLAPPGDGYRNSVTFTGTSGTPQVQSNIPAGYPPDALSRTINVDADGWCSTTAKFLLDWHRQTNLWPAAVQVHCWANAQNTLDVVSPIELRDYVTVKFTPVGATQQSYKCFVDGIDHDIDADASTWRTTLRLSSADRLFGAWGKKSDYLIIGDATYGLIGTGKIGPH